ncbi:MAG: chromate transporter [Clostridia bacterium]|nr:chromate transporter [Clostridia bacterium]
MIYLELFLTFLMIGAVSFGGGYGMIAMIREKCLANGWLTEAELMDRIAVAESTPGPIAVNMATFVGSSEGGMLGALFATLGVVLPSFIVILLIASVIRSLLRYGGVKAFLDGVRPAVVGLILATAVTMLLSVCFRVTTVAEAPKTDWLSLAILAALFAVAWLSRRLRKKKPSPIVMILLSAALGIILTPIFA